MSIDLTREAPIPLVEVPKLPWIPRRRGGRRLHVATVHRWCARGLHGTKLEYLQLGGTRVTTAAALMRFFTRLTGAPGQGAVPPGSQRQPQLERATRAVEAVLGLPDKGRR
jgi:hypothetical protein